MTESMPFGRGSATQIPLDPQMGLDVHVPPNEIRMAVTVKPRASKQSVGLAQARREGGDASLEEVTPTSGQFKKAQASLQKAGFTVTVTGNVALSARGPRELFEQCFGTRLDVMVAGRTRAAESMLDAVYYPPAAASWDVQAALASILDDAYPQWPHIYFNHRFPGGIPSPIPPFSASYPHLRVPGDVSLLLNVDRAHRRGETGRGVRVAMIDSGFATSHAYFVERGYAMDVVLAPGADEPALDGNGHGTGESANLLAVAPDVEFVGIKLDREDGGQGATVLEGFQTAVTLRPKPHVISVSLGYDLRNRTTGLPLSTLPNGLRALEAEVQAAVADGIVVVFAAGNGHIAFPGMMPEVFAAGGVTVAENGLMIASDYASAFESSVYAKRRVPDASGLVGRAANGASYIMLPVPSACEIDLARSDGTSTADGWAVFSGTSAAAPQIAGACALLLGRNPELTPAEVRQLLMAHARPVATGAASAASNPGRPPVAAPAAAGAGLIDVDAALASA